ncbi:MAG: tyrosine protein kinase [Tannerellaceae bacterium]|jgi:uncharacterized protein involved in exopolysaccharide biosynthesis|nr:tyrosine protein kinase [Tannerellaceae bacterium]
METKDNEVIGLKGVILKYMVYWKFFLAVFVISFIPAIAYLVYYPRTYEIMARIQIAEGHDLGSAGLGMSEAAGLMRSFGLNSIAKGALNIEDELGLMTSNALLKKMVSSLGVNVDYKRPHSFYRLYDENPYVLTAGEATADRLSDKILFAVRHKDGLIHINTKSDMYGKHSFTFTSLPATITLPEGDFLLDRTMQKVKGEDQDINITFRPAGHVAEQIEKDFVIEDVSKASTMIELSCMDYERKRGIMMLNKIIELYNEATKTYSDIENSKTITYLDLRIDTIIGALQYVEKDIATYKNANTLTDVEQDVTFYVEQMRDIQVKLIELESQSHLVEIMDRFVKDPGNKYSLVPALLNQESENSPLTLYNNMLVERARVTQNSNVDNPLVISLTQQVDQLRESVFSSISNARQATQQAIEEVKRKERAIFDKMESFPAKEREFVELKRQQEVLQGLYLILLQKREETALSLDLEHDKARIIDPAFVKSKPIAPRKLHAAIGIMLLTLIIPVSYLFFKEQLDVLRRGYAGMQKRGDE